MRTIVTIFLLASFCFNTLSAIGIEEIIELHKANVGDDIILAIIKVAKDQPETTTEDIIRLKRAGVNTKVITELILKGGGKKVTEQATNEKTVEAAPNRALPLPRRQRRREELSPFDQFFLSMYYSHDYGWPEKHYESPQDILSQGLYYQAPTNFPDARRVRVYGFGQSTVPGVPGAFTFSPYSMIVPRRYADSYRQFPYFSPRHPYNFRPLNRNKD